MFTILLLPRSTDRTSHETNQSDFVRTKACIPSASMHFFRQRMRMHAINYPPPTDPRSTCKNCPHNPYLSETRASKAINVTHIVLLLGSVSGHMDCHLMPSSLYKRTCVQPCDPAFFFGGATTSEARDHNTSRDFVIVLPCTRASHVRLSQQAPLSKRETLYCSHP